MTSVNTIDILRVLPEAVLSGFAVLVMVLDPFLPPRQKGLLAWLSLGGVIAAEAALFESSLSPGPAFNGAVSADPFSFYFIFLFLLVAALTVLGSTDYLKRDGINRGEFYALVLMATVGACFMAASTELIMVFIGLEISSISTYILSGFRRHDARSNEASLKYFLLGSFATAFFLYGIAFVYGVTGTTRLVTLSQQGVQTTVGAQSSSGYQQALSQYHAFGNAR